MRNTPNPGRTVDPRLAVPLPSETGEPSGAHEADEESGDATPDAAPADAQIKPGPRRNEQVGDGRPTRRWSETVDGERERDGDRETDVERGSPV
jgi:hypothetical protein